MNIGLALKSIRKKKGIKQNVLAINASISQTYLSQIEGGLKIPSIEVIEILAKEYKVPFGIMMWFTITEKEVPKGKLGEYKKLKPFIDNLIDGIFNQK